MKAELKPPWHEQVSPHRIAQLIDSGELDVSRFNSVEHWLTETTFYTSEKRKVEMYKAEATIPGHPMLPNNTLYKASWRYRQNNTRKWKKLVFEHFYNVRPKDPLEKFKLTYVWFGARQPDWDGMLTAMKPVQDGLIHAKVIVDDSPKYLIEVPKLEFVKVPPKHSTRNPIPDYKIKIIVEGE